MGKIKRTAAANFVDLSGIKGNFMHSGVKCNTMYEFYYEYRRYRVIIKRVAPDGSLDGLDVYAYRKPVGKPIIAEHVTHNSMRQAIEDVFARLNEKENIIFKR